MILGWRSSKAPLGFKDNPSHSQWISLSVTFRSSSGVSGQWKESRSSRFIRIQNPDPSHWRILINVRLRLHVRGKVILQSQGKEFFTWHGKDFFT